MKIITRAEMLKMPVGTVYSRYEPCVFSELYVKADDAGNYENDWLYDALIGAVKTNSSEEFIEKCELMEKGESHDVDFESTGRDGLFDDEQLYAIYEKVDVEKLIARLQLALTPLHT
jgi:hypothetical protein